MKKPAKQPKLRAVVTPIEDTAKTPPSHHVRLTPDLQTWAEEKAKTYRSVAAWIVDLVRAAYMAEQQSEPVQRKAA